LGFFQDNISWLAASILQFVKNIIRATYFTIGIVGFVLWSTGLSKYSGRRLLIGAVALALVSEILL